MSSCPSKVVEPTVLFIGSTYLTVTDPVFASFASTGVTSGSLRASLAVEDSLLPSVPVCVEEDELVSPTGTLLSAASTLPAFIKNTALVATETNPTDNFLKL